MGKKVKELTIKMQKGTNSTHFASWKFTEPKVYTSSGTVKKNALVSIKSGSKYYNGVAIPANVIKDKWYVKSVSGDKVVLGKNKAKTKTLNASVKLSRLTAEGTTTTSIIPVENTDHYEVHWYYATGDGVWFDSGSSNVTATNATYGAPDNATKIKVTVKPVSKTYETEVKKTTGTGKNKKTTTTKVTKSYWTGTSVSAEYLTENDPPATPSSPTVTIDQYVLSASVEITDPKTDVVEFRVYKGAKLYKSGISDIKLARAAVSCIVDPGGAYSVRCRAVNVLSINVPNSIASIIQATIGAANGNYSFAEKVFSDWTDYTRDVLSAPEAPSKIVSAKAISETAVMIDWSNNGISHVDTYTIEYTELKKYFDSSPSNVSSTSVSSVVGHAEITGLTSGKLYWFRVKATNSGGDSPWTDPFSIIVGSTPSAPTTWSSSNTVKVGESLKIHWVHNSTDESDQTHAQMKMVVNGTEQPTISLDAYIKANGETSEYSIDTTQYPEGAELTYQVRTAGITNKYSEWSTTRSIKIYAAPILNFRLTNKENELLTQINGFPITAWFSAGPKTQTPLGFQLTITSLESYNSYDEIGRPKRVIAGEIIASKYIKASTAVGMALINTYDISAQDVDFENNKFYRISCTVSMDNGLTATQYTDLQVSWGEDELIPDAAVSINWDNVSAYITPMCVDDNDTLMTNVELSVYRREFNGTFTEIRSNIQNDGTVTVIDPHPALDYARYRIIATSKTTGTVGFYDIPAWPIEEKAIIIQWDETWSDLYETLTSADLPDDSSSLATSMLKLPYNIDVSDNYNPDVSFIEYAGRKHPVDYYGTQVGHTSTWNVAIEKDDADTLYALRRLAEWMGRVYIREPSGSGYWASVKVSFSQTHCELTIPVTLDVTRVEGGM